MEDMYRLHRLKQRCPQDNFPLLQIELLVDSTMGQQMLSFMDAQFSYNQIQINPDDQEKRSFITNPRLYCYQVMLFRLKNSRAIYQRLVNCMFKKQIGRNMKVYVDDLHVKSKEPYNIAPVINYILFTDDILFFCQARVKENRRVQQLLKQ